MNPRSPHAALCNRAAASIVLALAVTTAARAQTAATAPVVTSMPLTFSGEVRTRSEWDAPNGLSADAFTYLRTRFGVRIDPAPGATLVLQLQDSRVLGTEGNAISGTTDVLDLHQGYLQLGGGWQSAALSARAGRQEIAIGNERLVGSVNWSNTGRSFDGVRLSASPLGAKTGEEPWTATAFAAIVDEHGRRFGGAPAAAASVPDHSMAGAYLTARLNGTSNADVTLLYDGGARYRSYAGADRTTLNGRVRTTVAGVALEGEGAVQSGSQRVLLADTTTSLSQQVQAWLVGARIGVPMGSRAVATLGVDVLSGDATPADGRYTAFSTIFGTNHPFYGLMDVIGDPAASTRERGLVDALAMATVHVSPAFTPKIELHRFTLADGGSGTLGTEGDLVAPLRVSAASTVELGYSLFRGGRAAADVGLGADGAIRQWMYLQLRAGF